MNTSSNNPPDQPHTYEVQGLHCDSCVNKVKTALMPLAENVEITLTPPRAIINGVTSLDKLNETLAEIGNYSLHEVSSDVVAKKTWGQILTSITTKKSR